MPTIGVADILVRPSFKGLQQTVAREFDGVIDQASERSGRSAGGKMAGALGTALKTGAVIAAGAAATGIGVALTKGFGRLQAIENAKAKLTGLGHDVQSVEGIMKDAMAAVKGTAFGLDEAASVAAGAVAAGVKPGKDLEKTLRLTGDAATIAGVGMGEMGAIFNKVASSNKIQGDVIAQLNDAGIPIVQLLGKELGTTAEETLKLASEGKVNFETFQKAMEQGLGGAALESGKTLQGAFKNTMAAVGRIGASLLSGVYPKIQQFFSNAIEWLKPLEEGAKVAGAAIGVFLEDAIQGAQGLYDLLVKGDYTGKLREAFGWEEDHVLVDFLLDVREFALKIPAALERIVSTGADVTKGLWDMRVPIGVVGGLIITALIPHWIALGVEALKSAAQQVLAWAMARGAAVKAAFVHSGAVTAMIGGWLLMGARALVQAGIIAGAWLIALGPVGWAIGIIAALVGAFVLAYNNIGWFRDGVDAAMRWVGEAVANAFQWVQDVIGGVADWFTGTVVPAWDSAVKAVSGFFTGLGAAVGTAFNAIGAAIGWVYNSVIKPVFDGISTAVAWVGGVFTQFYLTSIKPTFDSIGVIVNGFYMFFEYVFKLVAAIIQQVVIPLFKMFWDSTVQAFTAIGTAISNWWAGVVAVFNTAINYIRTTLSAAFTWFRDSVITPVWNGITSTIRTAWTNISSVFNTVVTFLRTALSAAFTWFRDSVVTPVFNGISNIVKFWWNNIVMPVFNAVRNFITNVLAPAFTWFRDNVIKPVWDGIASTIKNVWEKGIKPVFDTVSNFITKNIPDAFKRGVDFVKKQWEKLQEIVKAPIRFVVQDVINKGLIDGLNGIGGLLGIKPPLPHVALPPGFAEGGYTGPGGKYQPAGIVHAGEIVWSQADIARWGGVGIVESLRKAAGYAKGGLVNPLRNAIVSQPFHGGHNGMDFAAPTGTPIGAAGPGRVSSAGWSAHGGGNEIHIDHPNGLQTWYAHLSSFAVKMGDMVRAGQLIGQVGSTGNSTGPHLHYMVLNGGWPNYMNPAAYLNGGGEAGSGGWNPIAGIVDGLLNSFKSAFPAAGFIGDLAIGAGKKLLDGAADFIMGNAGKDNTGSTGMPYLHDQGGILPPGLSQVVNRTRKPEYILNPQQWSDIHRLATGDGGPRGGVNFHGPIHVRDENELARIIQTRQMDAMAVYR